MRKALSGLGTLSGPYGETKERATFSCAHCSAIRHVKPFCDPADLGGLCKSCMGVICEQCLGRGCDPLIKKIERMEAEGHARRWMQECL
jgi:hypothetical protein